MVSGDDVATGGITVPAPNQIHITDAVKPHSKNAFENVFGPDITQEKICSNVLPELVQGVFSGQDCTLIALGAKSRGKECLLYGTPPSSSGVFQTAITSVFKITDEYRVSKPDTRYQIRMSAIQYSQRENHLTDLLSPFSSDPRRRTVRVVDDPRAGALLENESEIRVDSPDLALFYLNTVADHRIVGGRRRLAIVDLGLGERNSHRGELTMPAIGSILLALVQGQKHLPARGNFLSQLLKCAMCPSRLTSFICSFAEKADDNENVVQLASKLSRAKRNTRKNKIWLKTERSMFFQDLFRE
ncbi:kinesin motor domain protein [Teladorsagia circumcincta]|uniref:Kinesin motor domain protein n=1 Tax=Teladorsagia circumcincta TaxID=45464 RepID=A0A2G9USG6_TELCI|nr:kinesin motor domain protein [Teladorsagia circumcincta]